MSVGLRPGRRAGMADDEAPGQAEPGDGMTAPCTVQELVEGYLALSEKEQLEFRKAAGISRGRPKPKRPTGGGTGAVTKRVLQYLASRRKPLSSRDCCIAVGCSPTMLASLACRKPWVESLGDGTYRITESGLEKLAELKAKFGGRR
jgi:hypothetical protein